MLIASSRLTERPCPRAVGNAASRPSRRFARRRPALHRRGPETGRGGGHPIGEVAYSVIAAGTWLTGRLKSASNNSLQVEVHVQLAFHMQVVDLVLPRHHVEVLEVVRAPRRQ